MEKPNVNSEELIHINIANLHIDKFIFNSESFDLLKKYIKDNGINDLQNTSINSSVTTEKKEKKEESDDIPYIAPKRIRAKRNFDK